ncbi:hypothetical protein B0H11DRAFT_2068779 [Mycena galericulata]|nr:hypothetical protein B0H11DRAFT_2068779 [Mycena galericulata]
MSTLDARASVAELLARASSYPCSAAPPAFSRLAQSTSTFQLALDALLPVLDPTPCQLTERILVSFILFALYAPHPIAINPFKSVLFLTFLKEREKALAVASAGGVSPNEPLVWVLWKILKGDGDDIGPYSPSALARSVLPPNFRATKLILDDTLYNTASDLDDSYFPYDRPASRSPTDADAEGRIVTAEEDARNAAIAHAMRLLLAARARVLSLAEQRQLTPLLPALATSALIAPPDLAPLVAHNPALAHRLVVALLSSSSASTSTSSDPYSFSASPYANTHTTSTPPPHPHPVPHPQTPAYLAELAALPPKLPTFDVLGRLLRDATPVSTLGLTAEGAGTTEIDTISALVRAEVLGRFVSGCIDWLERAEADEQAGVVADDRVAVGVRHLCRFYTSLLKAGLVDAASDADSAAMAHFSLRWARFEEANALYRLLAAGRGFGER